MSRSVADLKFDHTWSEHGVHQVWGLGMPLWRLPFEAAAKAFGHDGFPDHLALGLCALLISFVVLKVWIGSGVGDGDGAQGARGNDDWQLITSAGAGR